VKTEVPRAVQSSPVCVAVPRIYGLSPLTSQADVKLT
jgi:hypothetical protein